MFINKLSHHCLDIGLLPFWHQAITWIYVDYLSVVPLGIRLYKILIKIWKLLVKKIQKFTNDIGKMAAFLFRPQMVKNALATWHHKTSNFICRNCRKTCINSKHAELLERLWIMYSHFVSYLGFCSTEEDHMHNVSTLHVAYPIQPMLCLLMSWWLKSPGHQQTCYWSNKPEYSVSNISKVKPYKCIQVF